MFGAVGGGEAKGEGPGEPRRSEGDAAASSEGEEGERGRVERTGGSGGGVIKPGTKSERRSGTQRG